MHLFANAYLIYSTFRSIRDVISWKLCLPSTPPLNPTHHFLSSRWKEKDLEPLSDDDEDDVVFAQRLPTVIQPMPIVSTNFDPGHQNNAFQFRGASSEELWEETETERIHAKKAYHPTSMDDMTAKVWFVVFVTGRN